MCVSRIVLYIFLTSASKRPPLFLFVSSVRKYLLDAGAAFVNRAHRNLGLGALAESCLLSFLPSLQSDAVCCALAGSSSPPLECRGCSLGTEALFSSPPDPQCPEQCLGQNLFSINSLLLLLRGLDARRVSPTFDYIIIKTLKTSIRWGWLSQFRRFCGKDRSVVWPCWGKELCVGWQEAWFGGLGFIPEQLLDFRQLYV